MEEFRVQIEPGPHREMLHQKTTVATLNMGISVLFKTDFFPLFQTDLCVYMQHSMHREVKGQVGWSWSFTSTMRDTEIKLRSPDLVICPFTS